MEIAEGALESGIVAGGQTDFFSHKGSVNISTSVNLSLH